MEERREQEVARDTWQVVKSLPVATIIVLVLQFAYFSFTLGQYESQLRRNTERLVKLEAQDIGARLSRLEIQMIDVRALLLRIDVKLDKIVPGR